MFPESASTLCSHANLFIWGAMFYPAQSAGIYGSSPPHSLLIQCGSGSSPPCMPPTGLDFKGSIWIPMDRRATKKPPFSVTYGQFWISLDFKMARPEGFEPPTNGFGSHYSIRLSYGRVVLRGRTRSLRSAADGQYSGDGRDRPCGLWMGCRNRILWLAPPASPTLPPNPSPASGRGEEAGISGP